MKFSLIGAARRFRQPLPMMAAFVAVVMPVLGLWPVAVGAQTNADANSDQAVSAYQTYSLGNPLQAQTIPEAIGQAATIFTGIVGSFALLMFVYGGLLMLTSRGNSEQVQKGKDIFIWATLGLIVIFTAYIVLNNLFRAIGASE